jgi:drug/metabolite transporter (DMT)-like permease
MFLTTLLTSSAQLLYKLGVAELSFDIISIITNWQIIFGLMLYAIGAVIMIKALKYGDVSMLYPIIATSYIWVSIGSSAFFDEIMNLWKWLGVLTIMVGVSIISYGSKKEETIAYTEVV